MKAMKMASAILRLLGNNVHGMRAMVPCIYDEGKFPNSIQYLLNLDPDNKKLVSFFKTIKKA
jgi:hypothetical protein